MEFAKQRYIIKPGAIHVAQQFDLKVTTKQSPFSDGYDMARAALALGDKVNQKLTEDDEQFQQWEEFKAHELLPSNIYKRRQVESITWFGGSMKFFLLRTTGLKILAA
ncbi:hypothetical protein WJ008_000054 [Neisseria gonorrhoeae]